MCFAIGRRTDYHHHLLPVDKEAESVDIPVYDTSAHNLGADAVHPTSDTRSERCMVCNTVIRSRISIPRNVFVRQRAEKQFSDVSVVGKRIIFPIRDNQMVYEAHVE